MATNSSARAIFDAATALLSRGDAAGARRQGEQLLRTHPGNTAVLQLVGVACAQSGDPKRGAAYLRKAIAAGADTPDNRFNLARILLDAGDLDAAERICLSAQAAGQEPFAQLRAEILKRQGRTAEALRLWEDLVAARPDDASLLNNLGNARHAAGDLQGALATLQQARERDPASSLILVNVARVLLSLDRTQDACMVLEEAHRLAPEDPLPLLDLGRALSSIDHAAEALPALGTAARLDPSNPATFVAIGQAFLDLADRAQAERAFGAAIRIAPDEAAGYLNLGLLLEQANRIDELEALVARAQAAGATGDTISYLAALTLRRRGRDAEALAVARGVGEGVVDEAVLARFVGELSDRLGEHGPAWKAFERMNRAAAASPLGMSVDRSGYQRAIDRATAAATPEWFARWAPAPATSVDEAPIFLVGFPRSGTTLLDTFLLGHSHVHVLEEVPVLQHVADAVGEVARIADLSTEEVATLRARYFAELARVAPGAVGKRVVDKNPLSMLRLPLIHRLFPDARIVLALRHPADVVLSCVMQNFKPTEAMSSFLDLDSASRTYDRAFANFEAMRALLPVDIFELRYEDMIADPEAVLRPLVAYMGLEWEDRLLDHRRSAKDRGFIRTPSYAQVTEPVYARASGRWERYADKLRWSLPVLQPWIDRWGYVGGNDRNQPVTDSRGSTANGVT